jgi:hypothetical protein
MLETARMMGSLIEADYINENELSYRWRERA